MHGGLGYNGDPFPRATAMSNAVPTDAELGVLPVDDSTLSQMKREKLAAKDRLTRMYDVLHH